jgi:hypothetical protein
VADRFDLESTGNPEHAVLEANVTRALQRIQTRTNGLSTRADGLSDGSYTPAVPGDWTGTPPATLAAALDRIAAALGPIA